MSASPASSFSPDSACVDAVRPSPNFGPRKGCGQADILLLHYTGMVTGPAALDWLVTPESGVSCHYFVDEDGTVTQLVAEADRAWHAGVSSWAGITDINSHSIGIEIVNPGHEFGYREFPEAQIAAVVELCRDIVARNGIAADRVLGHSDVAPARKTDPGEKFPWSRLAAAGVGLWREPAPIEAGPQLSEGDSGPDVFTLRRRLRAFGYGLGEGDIYDPETALVVAAFQRHFRTARIDGVADLSTLETLTRLEAARAEALSLSPPATGV
ncbi:MAG: N-acetylmuramoyl-L-alanine amidase [Hyphomicrobiales bacterium]|nr:MAG: N-acetylmuramoyl-L-alanine amidase [Hyphomicrobiales bacterium]